MDNKNQLNLKGEQYRQMIDKFKQREEQTSLQQALVYLKLREFQCDNSKALIFAKKKEKCIDGTINKDGPPGFRKLEVLKPESKLVNGWLRGEKLRYSGTTGYSDSLHKNQSAEKREITKYNQKSRQIQEEMRKARSKSLVTIDVMKPRESLQKIGAIKEDASKERQNRNMYVEFNGVRLDQTTKNFFKDAENLNDDGLIVKLGAFDHIIADKDLTLKVDQSNMKGKTLTHYEVMGNKKRQSILTYQDKIREFTEGQIISDPKENMWKGLIHRKPNDEKQLFFTKGNVEAASNALILMNSKQLKRDLSDNEGRCGQNLTKYSSFYNSLQKAVTLEFLNKRKFSTSQIGFKKRRSLQIDREQ